VDADFGRRITNPPGAAAGPEGRDAERLRTWSGEDYIKLECVEGIKVILSSSERQLDGSIGFRDWRLCGPDRSLQGTQAGRDQN
jgi:hypothetical protein